MCGIMKCYDGFVYNWQVFIIEDHTVTMKCKTAINAMFLYFNLCPKYTLG